MFAGQNLQSIKILSSELPSLPGPVDPLVLVVAASLGIVHLFRYFDDAFAELQSPDFSTASMDLDALKELGSPLRNSSASVWYTRESVFKELL